MNSTNNDKPAKAKDDLFDLCFGSKATSTGQNAQEKKVNEISQENISKVEKDAFPTLPKKQLKTVPSKDVKNYAKAVSASSPAANPLAKLPYSEMVKKRTEPSPSSNANISHPEPEQAEVKSKSQVLNSVTIENSKVSSDTQYFYNTKITEALSKGNLKLAHQLLSQLEQEAEPNIFSLYPFLKYYSQKGQESGFKDILLKLKKFNLVKDAQVYASEVNLYASRDDKESLQKIKTLLSEMKKNGISQTPAIFSAYIKYYGKNPHVSMADLEKDFDHIPFRPDAILYNSLINCYVKRQDITKALAIFEKMKKEGIFPTESTYTTILSYYTKQGKEVEALDLVNSMLDQNLSPGSRTLTVLMNFYITQNNEAEATRYFNVLADQYEVTLSTFQTLLNFYYTSENYAQMKNLWNQMSSLNIKPNILIYNLMFNYGLKVNDQVFCENLLRNVLQIKKDDILQNNILRYYKQFVSTAAAYEEFKKIERPSERTFSFIISLLVSDAKIEDAENVLKAMQVEFTPTCITIDPLLRYYFASEQFDKFEATLTLIPRSTLPLHSFVNKYIERLVEKNEVAKAEKLMATYYEFFKSFDPSKKEYDLHGCSFGSAYILVKLLMSKIDKKKSIIFITGRSLDRDKERYGLRNYLIEKLKENHPEIIREIDPSNPGRLELKRV